MLKLIRIKHWIKNSFVFAPLIFSGQILNLSSVQSVILAALLFCIASSTVYIFNDIVDVEKDKKHPTKSKTRPIAAGIVSPSQAKLLLVAFFITTLSSFLLSTSLGIVLSLYLLLNIAYSLKLKQLPVIDIFCIAIGFVLRVYAGAVVLDVPVSIWMFISTLCLALFLASIKRRQELITSGTASRETLNNYSEQLLTRYAEISSIGALVFYSLYVALNKPQLELSIPLVLFGIFRYWYIVESENKGESPTDSLYSDPIMIITILLWISVCGYGLLKTTGL